MGTPGGLGYVAGTGGPVHAPLTAARFLSRPGEWGPSCSSTLWEHNGQTIAPLAPEVCLKQYGTDEDYEKREADRSSLSALRGSLSRLRAWRNSIQTTLALWTIHTNFLLFAALREHAADSSAPSLGSCCVCIYRRIVLTVAVTRHQQANSLSARYHHTDLVLQLDH